MTHEPYPLRDQAKFTDENDHNPIVLRDCPRCGGRGLVGESYQTESGWVEADYICPECDGRRTDGGLAKYFDNDSPPMGAEVNSDGWLRCPGCRKKFTIRDSYRWTGWRHITCGQRIRLAAASNAQDS